MEATEDIVVKRKRDESVVHLINSDIDTQEKLLIKKEETKGLDRLIKTERENTAEAIKDLMIDGVGINRKQDPLENEDRTEVTNKIEEKGFTQDNDGYIIIESVELKVEKNEEPGNDPLEDGDGGCRLENEMCLVKLADSKVYPLEGRALSTWLNKAQVLDFENNSGEVLESDGVVTYLGESERNITDRERDFTESEKDITEREHNIVNCQRNQKGLQGVLKSKETRNKSLPNKVTDTSSSCPRESSGLRNVTKKRVRRRYHCIDCGSYLSTSAFYKHRTSQNCTLVKSVCQHCGDKFIRKDFKQHLAICATKEKYKCQKCSEKFTSRFSLLEHYETHAGNDTRTVGQIPVQSNGQIYSSSADTIMMGEQLSLSGSGPLDSDGDDSQPKFKCQECNRQFSQLALLVSHSLVAHPSKFKTAVTYNCRRCNLAFESQAMYIEHLTTHSKTTVTPDDINVKNNLRRHYRCYSCCTVFDSHYKYIQHMLTHSKSKPENNEMEIHFKGDYYDGYMKHILTHSESNPVSPAISSQQSSGKQEDSSQITSDHLGNSNDLSNSLDNNASKLIKNYTQNVEKYSDLPNCLGTSDKHHRSNSSEDSTSLKHNLNFKIPSHPGSSNVQRESSNNRSSDPSRLLVLQNTEDQVSKHIEMPKHFSHSQAKNKRRLESIDAGESPNKIPKCPEDIESEKNKKLHECIRVNYKEEPFVCQLCHKAFKTQMALSAHEHFHCKYRLKHKSRNYKLKCQLCGEQFQSNLDLYNHIQLHPDKQEYKQNESKIECWICLKEFGSKRALRTHTSIIGNRPIKCSVCNKSFWSACSLSQHMNTHNTNSVTPQ